MDLVRDFTENTENYEKERQAKIVIRAIAQGCITAKAGQELLQDIWEARL